MKKLMNYTMVAFFATIALAIASPDKDKLIENEKAAWQTFKEKKADEFKKLLHADVRIVSKDGVNDLKKEMESMTKMDLKSVSFGDFDVVFPDADTGMLIYKVTVTATMDGKDLSGTYNCASVWHKQKDKWQAILHAEAQEEKPPAPPNQ